MKKGFRAGLCICCGKEKLSPNAVSMYGTNCRAGILRWQKKKPAEIDKYRETLRIRNERLDLTKTYKKGGRA
jgi:hypothetical protein